MEVLVTGAAGCIYGRVEPGRPEAGRRERAATLPAAAGA
jgi:hypothetical protein